MDNLGAIASIIWAVAGLVLAFSVAIYLWRRPDSSLQLRHKDSELNITPVVNPHHSPSESPQSVPATVDPGELRDGSSDPPAATEVKKESRFGEAYQLLVTGKYEEGMVLLEEEAREERDPVKQFSVIAFGQYVAAEKGSEKALDDLRRLASDHQGIFEIQLWFGAALTSVGSREEADKILLHAHSIAGSDEDRATALSWWASESPDPLRNGQIAQELLDRSKGLSDSRARSRVYARAARLYLKTEPPAEAPAYALYELALTLAPADTDLRFDVAHAFADSGAPSAAFLHYTDLAEREANNNGALNNLGVAASNLGLESIAVEHYIRSEQLGNTLATANLAWKLIDAGFLKEARTRLETQAVKPDVHTNVLEALGRLAKRAETDRQQRETILKKAKRVSSVRSEIGNALANGISLGPDTSGLYEANNARLRITILPDGTVTGELTSFFSNWTLSGRVLGIGILLSWQSMAKKEDYIGTLFSKKGHGVFIVTADRLRGFTYEGENQLDPSALSSLEEWSFRRS
jgi:tetratricopeptide (TPR) repeat protein